jgi:hypothetical protein
MCAFAHRLGVIDVVADVREQALQVFLKVGIATIAEWLHINDVFYLPVYHDGHRHCVNADALNEKWIEGEGQ